MMLVRDIPAGKVDMWERHEFVAEGHGFMLGVDKVGGGTLGREYTGDWTVTVYDVCSARLEDFTVGTGMPHNHAWVGDFVLDNISEDM